VQVHVNSWCLSLFLVPSWAPARPSTPSKCYKLGNMPRLFALLLFSIWTHIWVHWGAWGCVIKPRKMPTNDTSKSKPPFQIFLHLKFCDSWCNWIMKNWHEYVTWRQIQSFFEVFKNSLSFSFSCMSFLCFFVWILCLLFLYKYQQGQWKN